MIASLNQSGSALAGLASTTAAPKRTECQERSQEQVNLLLVLQAVAGLRVLHAADANAEQPIGAPGGEGVFVGLVVADIDGGVADEKPSSAFERHALGGRPTRNEADGIFPTERPRSAKRLDYASDRGH